MPAHLGITKQVIIWAQAQREGKDCKEAQEIFGILITCRDAGCDFKEKTTIKIKKFFISNRYIQSKLFFNKIDETNPPLTHRKHTKTCINN